MRQSEANTINLPDVSVFHICCMSIKRVKFIVGFMTAKVLAWSIDTFSGNGEINCLYTIDNYFIWFIQNRNNRQCLKSL